jgi:hypothetical protein
MGHNRFRFTLKHSSGNKVISEPEGWRDIKITLERDKEFHSLIEGIETPFVFYGSNGVHDGGRDFIKNINNVYGVDAQITVLIEISEDEVMYVTLFTGLVDMQSLQDIDSRRLQAVITRDDLWAKFKARYDTSVDLKGLVSQDNTVVSALPQVNLQLTSQKLRQKFKKSVHYNDANTGLFPIAEDVDVVLNTDYYMLFDTSYQELDEITDRYEYGTQIDDIKPTDILKYYFAVEYAGSYRTVTNPKFYFVFNGTVNGTVKWYLAYRKSGVLTETQIGSTIAISGLTPNDPIGPTIDNTTDLLPGDEIYVYGVLRLSTGGPGLHVNYFSDFDSNTGAPFVPVYTSLEVTADTIFPETNSESFFVHDVAGLIADRIISLNAFYSDYLGSAQTKYRTYGVSGCGFPLMLIRGLQLRQYLLVDKPFSISFKSWWDGINPIANLGLTYDRVNGVDVIRVEQKKFFYDDNPILYLDWVNNITEGYDKEFIFNKISIGYKEWQSEDSSGIDDPQTKHEYAALFKTAGTAIDMQSDFIAASLAIETTRRTTKKKSSDYKFDDKTFIVAINPTAISSPANSYHPELQENFSAVGNLINNTTRYNLALTPARNLLRWANLLFGCLQKNITSFLKFNGGEGNYDMFSLYNSSKPGICFNKTSEFLYEKQDISLTTYNPLIGYLFQPITYQFEFPISLDNYFLMRNNRTRAIAISTTDSNHIICHIKKLDYDPLKSVGTFTVWKK